jgi:hypothetical protein
MQSYELAVYMLTARPRAASERPETRLSVLLTPWTVEKAELAAATSSAGWC